MLSKAALEPLDWSGLAIEVATEQAMEGGKRDDLRIEAVTEDRGTPILLMTVEVKVGAQIHESGAVSYVPVESESKRTVNQLINYDAWLTRQPHPTKIGFIVSRRDKEGQLPENLTQIWRSITWGEVASSLAALLRQSVLLNNVERFLARHFIGFVIDQLGGIDMQDTGITFDDVAFLRALSFLGGNLNQKIDSLVAPLKTLYEEEEIGKGKTVHQKKVLEGLCRSVVYRELWDSTQNSPHLFAGVVTRKGAALAVWVETSPRHERKQGIRTTVEAHLGPLRAHQAEWTMDPDSEWWDLGIRMPLHELLSDEDQAGRAIDFVRNAFRALKTTGFLGELEKVIS